MCEALLQRKDETITMLRRENRDLRQELAEAKADIEKLEDSMDSACSAYGEMLLGEAEDEEEAGSENSGLGDAVQGAKNQGNV